MSDLRPSDGILLSLGIGALIWYAVYIMVFA